MEETKKDKEVKVEKGLSNEEVAKMFQSMNEKIESLENKGAMLERIADPKKLAQFRMNNASTTVRTAKMRTIGGKIIVGQKKQKDDVYEVAPGRWVEDQVLLIMFEDGTTKEMKFKDYTRQYKGIVCDIVGKREVEGNTFYSLKDDKGKVREINIAYIN